MSDPNTGTNGGSVNGDPQAAAPAPSRRPTKQLPTGRIQFSKQLDILRAFAAISGPGGKPVTNREVSEVVGMVESTVSMNNAFLTDTGLLVKTGSGFLTCEDVQGYHRAHEWNPETSAQKLAPTMRSTWFGELLITRLSYQPLAETQAISVLAEVAAASKKYERQILVLIEYLAESGIVVRDNGSLRLGPTAKPGQGEPKAAKSEGHHETPEATNPASEPVAPLKVANVQTVFTTPPEGVVQFHVSVKVDMAEFEGWEADRIAAFFGGIAQVLSAKSNMEGQVTGPTG